MICGRLHVFLVERAASLRYGRAPGLPSKPITAKVGEDRGQVRVLH